MSRDAMYNANSRYLHKMYRIHFSTTKVLEVYKSDYLVSSDIYEEAYKVSSSPFGDVTSNELELSLLNLDGMFNPKNEDSPYYGFIKRGVRIEAFIRPDEVDEWDPMGVFYVSDWNTSSSGTTADIIAYDKLYSVLNAPVPAMPILKKIGFADFMRAYFSTFGVSVEIDPAINFTLPYGYTSGYTDNRELLEDLMVAALADCYCKHDGNVVIRGKKTPRDLRATFTDSDQIMSVAIKQSISTEYDSASVICNAVQESAEQTVLSVDEVPVMPGITNIDSTKFATPGVVSVNSVRVESDAVVKPTSFVATPDTIICSLQSTANTVAQLIVKGTVLEKVSSVLATEGTSAVEIDSDFVQTTDNASAVLNYVDRYVNAAVPSLDLVVRGNPTIELGDKIHVISARYKINYVGIVTKVKYHYIGSLSCEMTLAADGEV